MHSYLKNDYIMMKTTIWAFSKVLVVNSMHPQSRLVKKFTNISFGGPQYPNLEDQVRLFALGIGLRSFPHNNYHEHFHSQVFNRRSLPWGLAFGNPKRWCCTSRLRQHACPASTGSYAPAPLAPLSSSSSCTHVSLSRRQWPAPL